MSNLLETTEKKEIAVTQGAFGAFTGAKDFETAQRMAKALAGSDLLPDTFRGNISNCLIGLEMANRIGATPLAVFQNLYIVYGKPAWSSQFLISCVNASGKFSPLRYKMTGKKGTDSYGCIAWAIDASKEELESPEVTIGMAKAEGWYGKKGSKWPTMAELMLRYRAATLFARLYSPELTMGIQTEHEIIDITPVVTEKRVSSLEQLPEPETKTNEPKKEEESKPASLAEILEGSPISEQDVKDYFAASKLKFEEDKIIENLKQVVNQVLDWKDSGGGAK